MKLVAQMGAAGAPAVPPRPGERAFQQASHQATLEELSRSETLEELASGLELVVRRKLELRATASDAAGGLSAGLGGSARPGG